jgi:hypothetical protein
VINFPDKLGRELLKNVDKLLRELFNILYSILASILRGHFSIIFHHFSTRFWSVKFGPVFSYFHDGGSTGQKLSKIGGPKMCQKSIFAI